MPETHLLNVYDPLTAPLRTMASFRSSLQSPPGSGIYTNISNCRWGDDGILTARLGTTKLTSAAIQTSDSGTSTGSNTSLTLKDTGKSWTVNIFAGAAVIIDGGTGSGQTGFVVSNTSNTLTVETAWGTIPDNTSTYKICAEPRSLKAVTWQGLNGKLLLAAKDWVTHKTSVYLSGDPTAFGSAITLSSGKYGDTRLASDGSGHDYPVKFAILSDRFTGKDVLVMDNGYDNPRVYDGNSCAVHQAIPQPQYSAGAVTRARPYAYAPVTTAAWLTETNSALTGTSTGSNTTSTLKDTGKSWTVNQWAGARVTITGGTGSGAYANIVSNTSNTLTISGVWSGSTPDNTSTYAISTSVNWQWDNFGGSQNYWVVTSSATSGLSGAIYYTITSTHEMAITSHTQQIIFTVQAPTATINDWLSNFKIELHGTNTAAWYTINDPTAGAAAANTSPLQIAGSNLTLAITHVAFQCDSLVLSGEAKVDGIRMTPIGATGPTLSANLSFIIFGVTAHQGWRGNTNFAITYFNSASRSESPSLILTKKSVPLSLYGMSYVTGSSVWPLDDNIFYAIDCYYPPQAQADADTGVDSARCYAQLTGEDTYTYAQTFTAANWGGASWSRSFTTGMANNTVSNFPSDRLLWLPRPDDFITPIPIGKSMIVGAASRLLVGARHESQDSFPRAALSEGGNGLSFRFASAPNLDDPATAYEDRIPTESIQNFVGAAASNFASPTLYAFTDASLFMVDTNSIGTASWLRRISSHGLIAPDSVAEHNGTIWYLDINLRIQQVGPSRSVPISLGLIDDKLLNIPQSRSFRAAGFWYKDRYYMPYTPSGGKRNTRVLVYSENAANAAGPQGYAGYTGSTGERGWESDDVLPGAMSAECACVQRDGNIGTYGALAAPRVLMLGQDMNIYQYETGTSDLGADIAVSITTGDLQGPIVNEDQQSLQFDRLHLITDAVNKTMTGTYTYKPDGGTSTVTIILSNASAYDWVKSKAPTTVSGQGYGVAGSINLAGSVAGGTRFYGMRVEIVPTDQIARMTS